MNGADIVVNFFKDKKVEYVFGYPGGPVLHLYDAIYRHKLNHVLTRHEQGAALAAEGYAKATGKVGVCFATSGPGATNLVTGLADAMLDSVPVMAITGQVAVESIGHDAFQEADILGITMPITKHNYLVRRIEDLPKVLENAWETAISGRPGPVLVDIPKNILAAELPQEEHQEEQGDRSSEVSAETQKKKQGVSSRLKKKQGDRSRVVMKQGDRSKEFSVKKQKKKIWAALQHSHRPMLMIGGGVTLSEGASELVSAFIKKTGIPVGTTLMGKGSFSGESLGMFGMHGSPYANFGLAKCDLLIGIGTRFSDRTIGNPSVFSKGRFIIHADIDAAEISKNMEVSLPVVADACEFLKELNALKFEDDKIDEWKSWDEEVKRGKPRWRQVEEFDGPLRPQEVIQNVALVAPDSIVATDVGQHQMFAAQHFPISKNRSFITSGGLGTMGFGLPAAIGVALGRPGENVVLFSGDGSIQMNVQELATLKRLGCNLKVFILDNGCLGMVRQWQEHFYDKRYSHSTLDDNPDFCALAKAYGLDCEILSERKGLKEKIEGIMSKDGPVVVHCKVHGVENVYPLIPPGKGPSEMVGVKE